MIMNKTTSDFNLELLKITKLLYMSKLNDNMSMTLNPDELKRMMQDYDYDQVTEFWDEEGDERVWGIKRALSQLDVSERLIFVLYLETQSERELGQLLGCSRTPVSRELKRIKNKIRESLEREGLL